MCSLTISNFPSGMIPAQTYCPLFGRTKPLIFWITSKCGEGRKGKDTIPLEFLLEWFLKSLFPYICKDVSTLGVTNEEEAILRARQLDSIYSQSGILYEIIHDAPQPTHSVEKPKPRPHADGVVGSIKTPV